MKIDNIASNPALLSSGAPTVDHLEQGFLEVMLKFCVPAQTDSAFGGGIGEDHFSSFLTDHYAEVLSRRLDLGFGKILEMKP